jgi:hypothetical protein
MIVDSCVNGRTGRSAALDYLGEIGVDCRDAVVAVVATHWHDDHVRRFAEVVARCEHATVFLSSAFGESEFLTLVEAKPGTTRLTGGAREMAAVIATLRQRRQDGGGPDVVSRLVMEEVNVYRSQVAQVIALSPSSTAIENAIKAFAQLLPDPPRPHLRVPAPSKNEASVVLWVDGPDCAALLGADLQREGADDRGWGRIVALGERGSATPQTSPKRLDSAVERSLKGVAKNRGVIGNNAGHVRARCAPADSGQWRVDLIHDAHPLSAAA